MNLSFPFRLSVTLVACALTLTPLFSSAGERLELGNREEFPELGIRLQLFEGFVNSPLPFPVAHAVSDVATGTKRELYSVRELWLRDQKPVVFKGALGQMSLAQLRFSPPAKDESTQNQYMTIPDYQNARGPATSPWTPSAIGTWLQYYTEYPIKRSDSEVAQFNVSYPYARYLFDGQNPVYCQAYVINLGSSAKQRLVVILFELNPAVKISNAERAIGLCLNSVRASEKTTADVARSDKFQSRRFADATVAAGDAYKDARKRVIDNISSVPGWWFVETPHYVITSNLTTDDRRLAELIQRNIETIRTAYQTLFPPRQEIAEISVIRIFRERQEYVHYVGAALQWTGGIWHPGRKELVVSPAYFYTAKESDEAILSTVYHEGFHQYAHYALKDIELPIWLNEGHAAFFESAAITQGTNRLRVGDNPHYLADVKQYLKQHKAVDFDRFFLLDQAQFYGAAAGDTAQAGKLRDENYALAWGIVYFLRKAAPLHKDGRYATLWENVTRVLTTKNGDRHAVAETIFRQVKPEALAADFAEFFGSDSKQTRARQNDLFR